MSRKSKGKGGRPDTGSPAADPASPPKRSKRKETAETEDFVLISKALSDPTRLSILRKIAAGQGGCGEMRSCLGVSAATLSHHMKELERAGLISLQREGRFVHAAVDRKAWKRHIAELKGMLP